MPIPARTLRRVALAIRCLPRLLAMRRRTWKAIAIGLLLFLLVLFVLVVWAVFALFGWLWSQAATALG